jgi:hypothetical protein
MKRQPEPLFLRVIPGVPSLTYLRPADVAAARFSSVSAERGAPAVERMLSSGLATRLEAVAVLVMGP